MEANERRARMLAPARLVSERAIAADLGLSLAQVAEAARVGLLRPVDVGADELMFLEYQVDGVRAGIAREGTVLALARAVMADPGYWGRAELELLEEA